MSGAPRLHTSRKSSAQSLQTSMRPPSSRSASRTIPSTASSPAHSVASVSTTRSRNGGASPTELLNARKAKDAGEASSRHNEGNNEANINVVVRCRTRSEREIRENSGVVVSTPGGARGKEVALSMGPLALSNKLYTFDRVFGPETDQAQIYDGVVAPMLEEMLSGYNCTIFAYGQTGTGKTYTMTGDMSDNFGTFADYAGIIPRTLYKLFQKLGSEDGDNSVKCSFIELYNEELRDLLAADEHAKVKIFEDNTRKGGVVVQGMEESYIKTAIEGVQLLQEGSHKRQVAATKCNDLSSRSHTVFTITVHVKEVGEDGEDLLRTGKLNLVDLAGSECIGRSGAENKRAREAGMINQSLLTLGRVINALVDKSSHIPYRESKLTRLLQDSLGGRTKTCIIATVSPAKSNLEETISTLDYASRAKNIRNKPQINQMLTKKAMIREYVIEIERLKGDLTAARQKNGVFLTTESYNDLTEESESRRILNEEYERRIDILEQQVKNTREQFEQNMRMFLDVKKELETTNHTLEDIKETLAKTETDLSTTQQNWEDETVLRKAHEETENELGRLGTGLIATTRQTVSDVNGLHAKIRRMADLEVVNHTTWTKSTNHVADITQHVEREIDIFTDEQHKVTDAVAQRITTFVEAQNKKLEEAYAFIESRFEDFRGKETELSNETVKSKDEMNEVLEEIKTLREEVKTRVGEGLQGLNDAAQRIAAEVIEDLGKFGAELQSSYTRLGSDFRGIFDDAQKHIAEQKAEVEKLRLQLTSATATAASATTVAQSKLDAILSEERTRAAADRRNLISQISSLINATADEQDSRLTKRVELVREEMGSTRLELEDAAKNYETGMDKWSTAEEKFTNDLAGTREMVENSLAKDLEAAEKQNTTIQATTQAIHAETVRLVDAQMQQVALQMQALDEFVTRARSQNEVHHEAFVSNLSGVSRNVHESFTRIGKDVKDVEKDVETFSADAVSRTQASKEALDPFSSSTREPLATLRLNIEAAQLREYVPTGQSPRKRSYDFPTTLPRTEAHEEILGRLRGRQYRPPLGEKEVLSPNKKIPTDEATVMMADPKAGGPGIGAAFYPNASKQKMFGGRTGTAPQGDVDVGTGIGGIGGGVGAGGSRRRLREYRLDTPGGSGDELDGILPATVKRTRGSKRKATLINQDRENMTMPITRKRSREYR